jgi:hypothetical protein
LPAHESALLEDKSLMLDRRSQVLDLQPPLLGRELPMLDYKSGSGVSLCICLKPDVGSTL